MIVERGVYPDALLREEIPFGARASCASLIPRRNTDARPRSPRE